jgi:hypothetical protein
LGYIGEGKRAMSKSAVTNPQTRVELGITGMAQFKRPGLVGGVFVVGNSLRLHSFASGVASRVGSEASEV